MADDTGSNALAENRSRIDKEIQRIRDAAKWAVATFVAVAGFATTGPAFSDLGALEPCAPWAVPGTNGGCTRFLVAIGGLLVLYLAILVAVSLLIPIMLPQDRTMKDFADFDRHHHVVKWFSTHEGFAGPFSTAEHPLKAIYERVKELEREAESVETHELRDDLRELRETRDMVLHTARYVYLRWRFGWALRLLALSGLGIVTGVAAFAWAATPGG
jgi:hypothetical protein